MNNTDRKISFSELIIKNRKILIESLSFDELQLKFVERSEFAQLLDKNRSRVFENGMTNYTPSLFEKERATNLLEQYGMLHTDFLILSDPDGNYVGHFTGETEDHNTFYLRNAGLLPEWRAKKIATRFIQAYLDYLYDIGYSRVTSQHHGTNTAVLITMLKLGFNICGVETREEWGTLVKFVKLLIKERQMTFKSLIVGQGRSQNT